MKSILKDSNVIVLFLLAFIVKAFLIQPGIGDSIAISSLSLLFGFKLWLDHIKKPDYNKEFLERLEKSEKDSEEHYKNLAELYEQRIQVVENKISTLNLNITKKQSVTDVKKQFGWS